MNTKTLLSAFLFLHLTSHCLIEPNNPPASVKDNILHAGAIFTGLVTRVYYDNAASNHTIQVEVNKQIRGCSPSKVLISGFGNFHDCKLKPQINKNMIFFVCFDSSKGYWKLTDFAPYSGAVQLSLYRYKMVYHHLSNMDEFLYFKWHCTGDNFKYFECGEDGKVIRTR